MYRIKTLEDHPQVSSPKDCQTSSNAMDPTMQKGSCRRNPEVEARLCAGGHRQVFGDTYWMMFAPVVSWAAIQCVFILALLLGWHMRSINFITAYTQADTKTDIFMQLPAGTTIKEVDPNKHLLKLQKKLYGLKDGQVPWHEHIKAGLLSLGF